MRKKPSLLARSKGFIIIFEKLYRRVYKSSTLNMINTTQITNLAQETYYGFIFKRMLKGEGQKD